jgi:hypothetical protein
MTRLNSSKTVVILLVTGLFLTALVPILNRYFPMPDVLKGFLMGLGLCIEVIALIRIDKHQKKRSCGTI